MSEKLSEHFTLAELTYSDTAKARKIDNTPTELHKKVLKHTAEYLLEKIRTLLNEKYKEYKGKKVKYVALKITSGYRSERLNVAVKGSNTSQHLKGEAADIEAILVYPNGVRKAIPYNELYEDIKAWTKVGKMSVDQCIQERSGAITWVHVSHSSWGASKDRKQFLKYDKGMYMMDCILK